MIMGVSLEVAKLVCATWIKQYWTRVPRLMKTYMVTAVVLLMLITSMGIFGFLSKAHNDQNLVSGDVGAKLAIYDEKIKTARDNIEAARKQLRQMDEAVDQVMGRSQDEKGADKAVAIRNGQKRDRANLAREIETNQKTIAQLNEEAAPIRAENRKVEAEVGPIKYIAAFLYGTAPDATMLEKAVTWIIITIVIVFDPLAVIMLLASQMTFAWHREEKEETDEEAHNRIAQELNETMEDLGILNKPEDETITPKPVLVEEPVAVTEPQAEELSQDEIDHVNELAESAKPEKEIEYFIIEDADDEEDHPYRGQGQAPSMPMQASYIQPTEGEKQAEAWLKDEYYDLPEVPEPPADEPNPRANEAAPGPNRGVMYSQPIQADNVVDLGRPSNTDFGTAFPINPQKGDVYLRTDYLPNRLFKFNGQKWIQVDKDKTDVYAYEDRYIQHLITELEAGRYDAEMLTDIEREQIRQYLERNA
jgi:hypothetical protein